MFFHSTIQLPALTAAPNLVILQQSKETSFESQQLYLQQGQQFMHRHKVASGEFIILGDPVFPKTDINWESFVKEDNTPDQNALFQTIRGHYYWFYLQPTGYCVGSSLSAIYPIYYSRLGEEILLSSSSFSLASLLDQTSMNRRNLLERLLFNYTFFDSTWWNEISLLPSHRYLRLDQSGASIAGDFEVANYFGEVEDYSKKSLQSLAKVFQEETALFFPDAPFGISLTGGFDGRTLVAAARKANKKFSTYSFGRPGSSDITFPQAQAPKLNIPYTPILLNEAYLQEKSLGAAEDFMSLSEYNGNLGRPHYAYAAKALSKDIKFILTGNFGSELFRALHEPGVMISQCLIDVFLAQDDSWKEKLTEAVKGWDATYFEEALAGLIQDLDTYLSERQAMDPNHRFYQFVYDELFRKYFGPELQMQSHYFNNRTPYLSLHLMQALNRTIWSGVHARLFEQQKSRRMKGQMFYSAFLRYADRQMYHMTTNKAYSPADVLEKWRFPLLVTKVLIRRYAQAVENNENATEDFFLKHFASISSRIQWSEMPAFIQDKNEQSQQEVPESKSLTYWIKFYSIVGGWDQAKRHTQLIKQQ